MNDAINSHVIEGQTLEGFFASNLFAGLLLAGAVYFVYAIYWELTTGLSRRRLRAERGCQEILHENPYDVFGLNRFREIRARFKDHTVLEVGPARFAKNGNTFKSRVLGREIIMTIEPENLRTILATDFEHWHVGEHRKPCMQPVVGENSIVFVDGPAWKTVRTLYRPTFQQTLTR